LIMRYVTETNIPVNSSKAGELGKQCRQQN